MILKEEDQELQDQITRTTRAETYLARFRAALELRHHELRTKAPLSNANQWAEHWFWAAVREIWTPEDFYVHDWAVKVIKELCSLENPNLAIFGAKQTSKSTTMACFSLILFWAFKGKACIIYRTTTLEEAMQRGWGEIERLHTAAKGRTHLCSHYMRSQPPKIVDYQGTSDLKRAIIMKPAKSKSKTEGSGSEFGNIKGYHADIQLVIDDELNELPDNASKAPQALDAEYKIFWYVGIGNPTSWDDVLGRLATPTEVTIKEIEELDLEEWRINRGKCIRFAAYRSPNIRRGPKPDGTWHYTHLPVPGTYEMLIEQCGGSEDHPDVWQFGKALPHPQAAVFTVMSRALVKKNKADQPAVFADSREVTLGATLDPSFTQGGDDCMLRFLQWGQLLDGGWCFEFLEPVKLQLALGKEDEMYFFIAEETRRLCEARGVEPQNFAFDCTGTGLGLKSVFSRVWPGVQHYVEYGHKPTDRKFNIDDNRPANKLFVKRACEISFTLRSFVDYAQVRGLYGLNEIIVQQGSMRRWWKKGNLREVESKDAIYQRNSSCDDWDTAAIAADMLRQKGFLPGGQGGGSAASHERQTGQHQQNLMEAEIHRLHQRQATNNWHQGSGFNPAHLDGGFDESDLSAHS